MNLEDSGVEAVAAFAYDLDLAKPLPKRSWKCFLFGHNWDWGPPEIILSANYVPPELETPTLVWSRRPSDIEQAVAGKPGWYLLRTVIQRCKRCSNKHIMQAPR